MVIFKDRLKAFLGRHKDLVNVGDWEELYDILEVEESNNNLASELTKALYATGVDVLNYFISEASRDQLPKYAFMINTPTPQNIEILGNVCLREGCFLKNENIVEVNIEGLSVLEDECLSECENLELVALGDHTSLSDYCLSHNPKLKQVILPRVIDIMGFNIFVENPRLEKIIYNGSQTDFNTFIKPHLTSLFHDRETLNSIDIVDINGNKFDY